MSSKKDKRQKELEKEIEKLQRRLRD